MCGRRHQPEEKEKAMPSHEHPRSRRQAPVESRPPEEIALSRAIMLARTLRWREAWQAEMAARAARKADEVNGHAAEPARPRPRRRSDGTAAQFAGAVARNELGRFYWGDAQEDALAAARKGRKPKQKLRKPTSR
jgi:hypothetical protein